MKKPDITGHVLFCDDIRRELTGQSSYIGVYNSPIKMDEGDDALPLLCIVAQITFSSELAGLNPSVEIEKIGENGDRMELARGDLPTIPSVKKKTSGTVSTVVNFRLEMPPVKPSDRISVFVKLNEDRSPIGGISIQAYAPDEKPWDMERRVNS